MTTPTRIPVVIVTVPGSKLGDVELSVSHRDWGVEVDVRQAGTNGTWTPLSMLGGKHHTRGVVMFTREYRTIDKAEWGAGPWQDEPDKAQWIDPDTGLDCLLVRNGAGALCGYVGVPPEHPWHGKGYSECLTACGEDYCYEHSPDYVVQAHGGLTFAAPCADTDDEANHICHVPEPGRPADVWWFGFDCAHAGDVCPSYAKYGFPTYSNESYKDVAYVVCEVSDLAAQLKSVA